MFLTTPLTTAPSCNVFKSSSRSAPRLASSTARRETTTLLRLRSSLMTLNSRSLPSNGPVSLTGRMSTSEPGRNARQPRFAVAVFEALNRHGDEVAGLDLNLALVVLELFDGNKAFRFQSGVDDDDVVVDPGYFGGNELALAHLLPREGFLEQGGEVFLGWSGLVGGGRC